MSASHYFHPGQSGFPAHHRLIVLEEVGSTNSEAMGLGLAGEAGPLWVMARRQTAGKGRSGRRWDEGDGNLYVSLLLSPGCAPASVPQLSFVAGLALHDAVSELARTLGQGVSEPLAASLRLKWPNDGLIGTAKFAGILCESLIRGGDTAAPGKLLAVIGIGVNLASSPPDLNRPVTSLRAHGMNADPETMLAVLAGQFAHWLDIWQAGAGFAGICSAWRKRSGRIGEAIGVHAGGRYVHGTYAGLDDSGALLLRRSDGEMTTVTFGDVTLCGTPEEI